MNDAAFMERALALAGVAAARDEVPVGAVLVQDGEMIGEGHNAPIGNHDPSAHAEVIALRAAGKHRGAYRLPGTTLYVTLEPCSMCVGALIHARVERIVFAASDPKTGACGGAISLHDDPVHNHCLRVRGGLMAEASARLLRDFFRVRREGPGNP